MKLKKISAAMAEFIGEDTLAHIFAWVICSAIIVLSILILWMTFVRDLPFQSSLTVKNYAEVFNSRLISRVVPNTVMVGLGTVGISLFFGIPTAWLLNRTDLPLRSLSITFIATTVIIPGLVKAMGWIMLLSPRAGLINRLIMDLFGLQVAPFDINSIWGIAFVQGLMLTPTMFFLLSGPMGTIDPALEEAAVVVGASRWKTVLRITLPMLWPAILGGIIYIFMTAIALFEVASLLGGLSQHPVLATELFMAVHPVEGSLQIRYGIAGIYGLLIIIPSLIALFFYFRSIQQVHRYAAITGKGYRPKTVNLGVFRYPALLFVFLYLALAEFLPLLALLWLSLLPSLRMPSREALSSLSFRNYEDIIFFMGGFTVIKNTVVLVVVATLLVLFFSFMISWVVVRTRLRTRRFLDTVAMLPHAIPGLGFAFALLVLGIMMARWVPWIPFYNTIWIIIAGNVLNRLSYATRITNVALLQVAQELEDAAVICGAKKWKFMWRVMVPLVGASLMFAGIWTALLVFRDVSIALFLRGSNNVVLAARLWNLWWRGDLGEAAALSIVMVLILGLFILILQKTIGRIVGVQTGL